MAISTPAAQQWQIKPFALLMFFPCSVAANYKGQGQFCKGYFPLFPLRAFACLAEAARAQPFRGFRRRATILHEITISKAAINTACLRCVDAA
jgi:hypothetical protein